MCHLFSRSVGRNSLYVALCNCSHRGGEEGVWRKYWFCKCCLTRGRLSGRNNVVKEGNVSCLMLWNLLYYLEDCCESVPQIEWLTIKWLSLVLRLGFRVKVWWTLPSECWERIWSMPLLALEICSPSLVFLGPRSFNLMSACGVLLVCFCVQIYSFL